MISRLFIYFWDECVVASVYAISLFLFCVILFCPILVCLLLFYYILNTYLYSNERMREKKGLYLGE